MAQEYSYRRYDIKDGLAGSTVYFMLQDKEGFIWFATETGVSRFDGTSFKNFTTKDGLPDNTIIRIFEDSRGRIWLSPFKNALCYYYKGKIYNQQNDSLLKKIHLSGDVVLREDKYRNILLIDGTNFYYINPTDNVNRIGQTWFAPVSTTSISVSDTGHFYILNTFKLYTTDTRSLTFQFAIPDFNAGGERIILSDRSICWVEADSILHIKSGVYKLDYTFTAPPVNSLTQTNDSVICLNTTHGAFLYNILRRTIDKQFLIKKNISRFLTDREGGYWFSTFNSGVYRLNSTMFKNITCEVTHDQKMGVYDLQIDNGIIWAASDMGCLQKVTNGKVQLVSLGNQSSARAVSTVAIKNGLFAVGTGTNVFLKDHSGAFKPGIAHNAVKQIVFKNDHELLVAGSNALYAIPVEQLTKSSFLWNGRTTCLFYQNDSIWFGSFNGLYLLKPDRSVFNFGDSASLLQGRIMAIKKAADGTIWVATAEDGVIGLKNNRIKWHFTEKDGLGSNMCRCLSVDSDCIWAGTDKGLSKIAQYDNAVSITKYSSADGLISDIINTILINENRVYVGTPEGISYFDKTERLSSSICDLKLLGIRVGGKDVDEKSSFNLKYGNNIRFDYVGLSFKSAGNILYKYRLRGLDTVWKATTQTSLEFISLPPGKYTLELIAINKFDVKSAPYIVQIIVRPPVWQTSWFIAACIVFSMLTTWVILAQRNRLIRNKEQARRQIEQQLLELEQKALRAQMNPHFIFNSLNSIQGFILDKDIAGANKYLSQFARLIRQTLDNSFQSQISLADEIKYLTTYLQLEQMRNRDRFDYTIDVDKTLVSDEVFIPGMVLQPFIENAIRHGMQNKNDKNGKIVINFSRDNNTIGCSISDNGVGRKEALALKAIQGTLYQSRGMQLTTERIELINKNQADKITVKIIDHEDNEGKPAGTEVRIRFPFLI